MNFIAMYQPESLHSTVIDLRTTPLDHRSLIHVLTESRDGARTFYSMVSALLPCTDPQNDICIVHDITGEKEKAADIFHRLVSGTVTPCTLEDILSDLL